MSSRVLFPFVGATVSRPTLDAALALARARDATLVPTYLVVVPPHLSLESAATLREAETALPMLELIDQLASRAGVPVDSRMERGRSHRQALASIVERERFDTLAVPMECFGAAEVEWLFAHVPGEVLVLAPEPVVRAPRRSGATS